ncbi:unnamed protein product [Caenorhabditis nigoni]
MKSGDYPITSQPGSPDLLLDIRETKIDIYPAPSIVEVEQTSFYSRVKKFVANTMANMLCTIADRPYLYFTGRPLNVQTVYITNDELPPV